MRSELLRLAASLPKGSKERRKLLGWLSSRDRTWTKGQIQKSYKGLSFVHAFLNQGEPSPADEDSSMAKVSLLLEKVLSDLKRCQSLFR